MKYFSNCKTIDELKKEYKKIVMELHPDLNKDRDTTKDFQEMQNEYEKKFEEVKNIFRNEKGETYQKENEETSDEFRNIIEKIIHFEFVEIDIIGNWIWLTGNTKKYSEEIKKLGFRWSKNKIAWYYHKDKYYKKSKISYTIEELKERFGSTKIEKNYSNLLTQ